MSQRRTCTVSGSQFLITDDDIAFYKKFDLPLPTLAPAERMRRRFTFRNERSLYRRTCSRTGKPIIAMFSPEKPMPVYSNPAWWSDDWDARDYGRDFDFSKTFVENFKALQVTVPLPALGVEYSSTENSDYCNMVGNVKDCYLLINSDYSERCLYGKGVNRCYDCVDCFKIYDCQACYELCNCNNCSFSTYLSNSQNCDECHFSENLIGCSHCFGSVNLRNQRHCFFNEPLREEAYQVKVREFRAKFNAEELTAQFRAFRAKHFVKWMQERNTENCTGDYLVNCKNCIECYDSEMLENSNYCSDLKQGNDVSYGNYDVSYFGVGVTECYDCISVGYPAVRMFFCNDCWPGSDLAYCWWCVNNCQNLFGCVGMKKTSYAILNKPYSERDFCSMKGKIIDHMKETKEWGEFFPINASGYGYNETIAQEYFPLTKAEATQRGYIWRDEDRHEYQKATAMPPASIADVHDDILQATLACEVTGKNYRIQKTELAFYRKFMIPIPKYSPDERHRRRLATRNPRKLYERRCAVTGESILTTIPPERAEPVYGEEAYLKAIA